MHAPLAWRKSRASGTGNCVEVAMAGDGLVHVRDSKAVPSGPQLAFTQAEWVAFVAGVEAGEFSLSALKP
ncbi:MAG TPA: DUF397 domain-containing protein [Pseudonocardiaceae bacterium]